MAKLGRPTLYCEAIAEEICDRLSEGESLRSICNGPMNFDPLIDEDRHSHLPNIQTVMNWALNPEHDFFARYAQAREAQAEGMADRMMEAAENYPDVQRAKLVCDNIKWIASRLIPHRYGDRLEAAITDPGGHALGTGAISQLSNLIANAVAKKQGELIEASDDDYNDIT